MKATQVQFLFAGFVTMITCFITASGTCLAAPLPQASTLECEISVGRVERVRVQLEVPRAGGVHTTETYESREYVFNVITAADWTNLQVVAKADAEEWYMANAQAAGKLVQLGLGKSREGNLIFTCQPASP